MENIKNEKIQSTKEILIKHRNGMPMLILGVLLTLGCIAGVILIFFGSGTWWMYLALAIALAIAALFAFSSIKILRPQEAVVYTLFGEYYGTLKGSGIFLVNPFLSPFAPELTEPTSAGISLSEEGVSVSTGTNWLGFPKDMSLKTKTINNDKQKVNDLLGNPIIVDTMVVWRVVDTAKASFDVENYIEYLSSQCDAALRGIISLYPYDVPETDEKSLRCSIDEISEELKKSIQTKAEVAGLEILEARITNMYYAPEIASAMLQRQQAKAIIDAKQTIVEGAVDIVDMALDRLSENDIVELDEERKATMVSNLLVVLCGGKEAQPVINSGSLY